MPSHWLDSRCCQRASSSPDRRASARPRPPAARRRVAAPRRPVAAPAGRLMPDRGPHLPGGFHDPYAQAAGSHLPQTAPYALDSGALPPLPPLAFGGTPDPTSFAAGHLPPLPPFGGLPAYRLEQSNAQADAQTREPPRAIAGQGAYTDGGEAGRDMTARTRRSSSRQQEPPAPAPSTSYGSGRSRRSTAVVSYAQYAANDDSEEEFKPAGAGRGAVDDDDDDDEEEVMPTRNTSRRYQQQSQQQHQQYPVDAYDHAHNPYAVAHGGPPTAANGFDYPADHTGADPDAGQPLKVTLKFGAGAEQQPAAEAEADAEYEAQPDGEGDAPGEIDPEAAAGHDAGEDEDQVVGGRNLRPRRGRIVDSEDSGEDFQPAAPARRVTTTTSSGRQTRRPAFYGESDNDEESKPTRGSLRRGGGQRSGYHGDGVEQDEDYQGDDAEYGARRSTRQRDRSAKRASHGGPGRRTRNSRRADRDGSFEGGSTDADTDEEMLDLVHDDDDNDSLANEHGTNGRTLRNKPRINYYAPLQIDAPSKDKKDKGKRRQMNEDGNPFAGLPANMTGAQWAELYPEGGHPTDSVRPPLPFLADHP